MHEVEDFIYPAFGFFRCEPERHTARTEWIRINEEDALFEYGKTGGEIYCRRRFTDTAFRNRYSYYFCQKKLSVISVSNQQSAISNL